MHVDEKQTDSENLLQICTLKKMSDTNNQKMNYT
jgi:hypothetical protein